LRTRRVGGRVRDARVMPARVRRSGCPLSGVVGRVCCDSLSALLLLPQSSSGRGYARDERASCSTSP
jgi:hypothetical protein